MNTSIYPYLWRINGVDDLRKFPENELVQLAHDIRKFIIDIVSVHGGHFSANLGTVELAVALHYCFNTPEDKLVWDVGHQAYAHKIITGRKDYFETIRKENGLSGFPSIFESEFDTFGTGHSSTSISAVLGMALASKLDGNSTRQHIAVIGDGALTAGMAFEAVNHAGSVDSNILVVLNDNSISIDPNVGALKNYLNELKNKDTKENFHEAVEQLLTDAKQGGMQEIVLERLRSRAGQLLSKDNNFFESLNIKYFGPIDGHDIAELNASFEQMKQTPGPKLLHVITLKGKGYAPAELEQTKWHAPGQFDKLSGAISQEENEGEKPIKYQEVFGHTLLELAMANPNIIGITPAMPSGCSMDIMMQSLPERVFDVGIAEQHAVTLAAGLAISGKVPFCNLYATFAQRAYDQIIHDVVVQNLPVIFCLDRAGLVGADGATHQGVYDIPSLRCLPNMVIAAPKDEHELRNLMFTATRYRMGPFVIRYPRGKGKLTKWKNEFEEMPIGEAKVIKQGERGVLISTGTMFHEAQTLIQLLKLEGIHFGLVHFPFIKPLDENLLEVLSELYPLWISIEDGAKLGGFGSSLSEWLHENDKDNTLHVFGVRDEVILHATQQEQKDDCMLTAKRMFEYVMINRLHEED